MVYELKSPILGFEQIAQVEFSKIDDTFAIIKGLLQNGSESGIEFRLVNPYALKEDYSFTIPVNIQALTEIKDNSKVNTYCILLFQEPAEDSKINFIAPLIFNEDNKTAAQVILDQSEYPQFGVAEPFRDYIDFYELKGPILGLEHIKRIELHRLDDRFARIYGFQEDGSYSGICIHLVNPFLLKADYKFEVPDELEKAMDMQKTSSVMVYCPMVLQEPVEKSFVNFLAPIVFHERNYTAAQIALQAMEYPSYGVNEPIEQYL